MVHTSLDRRRASQEPFQVAVDSAPPARSPQFEGPEKGGHYEFVVELRSFLPLSHFHTFPTFTPFAFLAFDGRFHHVTLFGSCYFQIDIGFLVQNFSYGHFHTAGSLMHSRDFCRKNQKDIELLSQHKFYALAENLTLLK